MKKSPAVSAASLRRPDWLQIWAGGWSILSCSHFALEYPRLIKFHGRPFLPESVTIIRHGKSEGWARQKDREAICAYLAKEVTTNTARAKAICLDLKHQADSLRTFMGKYNGKQLNERLYLTFWDKLVRYYQPHINVKYVVDGLPADRLEELLPFFEDARRYAENVLNQTEEFIESFAKTLAQKAKLPRELVLGCVHDEIMTYWRTGKLPQRSALEKRQKLFGIYCDKRRYATYVGPSAEAVVRVLTEIHTASLLRGTTAYPGIIRGTVRVIVDPKKSKVFNTGDILVSGMTRPEFLPLMKKAGGFVTDSGGILSHAAIVAREMKKPCVINTKVATKALKDGDEVEVDATKGIVKKL